MRAIIWSEENLKAIQRLENFIVDSTCNYSIKNAKTQMEIATEVYIKQTKPLAKPAPVNFIGRCEYSFKGELIGFHLEPITKYQRQLNEKNLSEF